MLRSDLASSTDSVISSSKRDAGSPADAKALMTVETRLPLANWSGDRLTETQMSDGHFMASAHAFLNAHSPRWTIRPISSATGMNSDGGTMPCFGCSQRINASNDVTFLVCKLTSG